MKRIRNFIRYIIVMCLNIFIMLTFQSYVNFIILVAMVIFPLYSVLLTNYVKRSLTVQMELPREPMKKDEEFFLYVTVHNRSVFSLVNATMHLEVSNPFYGDIGSSYLNIPIRARKDTKVECPIIMERVGQCLVRVNEIRLADLLGIYETGISLEQQVDCLVFPCGTLQNQEAGQLYLSGVTEAMESKEKGYDFSDVAGIREYIPGDKLQNIHWKLSVKKDELMVKERVSVSAMQLNVLLELANDAEMKLESVLALADGITRSFVTQNLPFTLHYYSVNMGDLRSCYIGSEMERLEFFEMLLYDRSYHADWKVEELFYEKYGRDGTYLYLGYMNDLVDVPTVYGKQQVFAQLRQVSE